jgi:hypothetical protein
MQVTLTEEIGAAAGQEVSSKAEARRLAFYLFWNIKPYFDRCVCHHCRPIATAFCTLRFYAHRCALHARCQVACTRPGVCHVVHAKVQLLHRNVPLTPGTTSSRRTWSTSCPPRRLLKPLTCWTWTMMARCACSSQYLLLFAPLHAAVHMLAITLQSGVCLIFARPRPVADSVHTSCCGNVSSCRATGTAIANPG